MIQHPFDPLHLVINPTDGYTSTTFMVALIQNYSDYHDNKYMKKYKKRIPFTDNPYFYISIINDVTFFNKFTIGIFRDIVGNVLKYSNDWKCLKAICSFDDKIENYFIFFESYMDERIEMFAKLFDEYNDIRHKLTISAENFQG